MVVLTISELATDRQRLELVKVEHGTEIMLVLNDYGPYKYTGGAAPAQVDLEQRYTAQVADNGNPDE
jgi:hypothetical protein